MTMREQFEEWIAPILSEPNDNEWVDIELAWRAYRAGQEEMREKAAKVCDYWQNISSTHKCGECMAYLIRKLSIN